MDHKEFFERFGSESFNNMPGLSIEICYQYFKQWLLKEVFAEAQITHDAAVRYPLIDTEQKQ